MWFGLSGRAVTVGTLLAIRGEWGGRKQTSRCKIFMPAQLKLATAHLCCRVSVVRRSCLPHYGKNCVSQPIKPNSTSWGGCGRGSFEGTRALLAASTFETPDKKGQQGTRAVTVFMALKTGLRYPALEMRPR